MPVFCVSVEYWYSLVIEAIVKCLSMCISDPDNHVHRYGKYKVLNVALLKCFLINLWILTLSCPGMGRAVVKIGHSNLRPDSKELKYLLIASCDAEVSSSL